MNTLPATQGDLSQNENSISSEILFRNKPKLPLKIEKKLAFHCVSKNLSKKLIRELLYCRKEILFKFSKTAYWWRLKVKYEKN